MNREDLHQPQRQSLVGVAVIFFRNLRIAVNVFISVIIVQFGLRFSFFGLGLEGLGVILAFVFLIISYLQYRRFFFYVVEDKFIIEKGLISRDRITIPFDRIQTVNLNQNIIQQLLNVMAVKVDTAGSSGKELEISALPKAYARELQKFLMAQKQARQELEMQEEGAEQSLTKNEAPQLDLSESTPLVKLGTKDLLRVGLTENHLRTGLILFAVINGYVWQFEEYLLKPFEPFLREQANYFLSSWLFLLPIALLIFVVVSVLLSMIQTTLKYYKLRFFVDAKGVQLVSGLLKRAEYQIPVNKIQYLKWKSNPLRKLIGLKTLLVKQASTEEVGDRQLVRVPGVRYKQLQRVLDEFYPERKQGLFYIFRAHKLLFLQRGTWLGLVPAMAMAALSFIDWRLMFVSLAYLPLALFFIYEFYLSVGLAVNSEMLILRKGWVYPSRVALKFYKLQDVKFSQSIFQKRRKLASITFYTAAGDEQMPHIPEGEALQLYNYALYKIESSEKEWM